MLVSGVHSPKHLVHAAVEWAMVKGGWLPAVVGTISTVAASVLLATVGDLSKPGQIARFWLGVALSVVSAFLFFTLDWWRRKTKASRGDEVAQYSLTLSDAIQPMAEAIAAMPGQDAAHRKRTAAKTLGLAASSLQLMFRSVPSLRVVVYEFNSNKKDESLEVAYSVGRASKPRPFKQGDRGRGDAAFTMIHSHEEPLFVEDVTQGTTPGWEGSGKSYKTFISVPIRSTDTAFGMLTIDSPLPGSITENDKGIVLVLATLLAIAMAERDRR